MSKRNILLIMKNNKFILEDNFVIPTTSQYIMIANNNYRVIQLKTICKKYRLSCNGNKEILRNRIYIHLFNEHHVLKIQSFCRKLLILRWFQLLGPGFIRKQICNNSTDFITLDEINTIPCYQFFSYKDENDFIYAFDIISFNTLLSKSKLDNNVCLNPYNRNVIKLEYIDKFINLIRVSKVLNFNTIITTTSISPHPNKELDFRILDLFHRIDSMGYITNHEWFNSLVYNKIKTFVIELKDIWEYRANISNILKKKICPPHGDPFIGFSMNLFILSNDINLYRLKKKTIHIMENIVYNGIDQDSKYIGSSLILTALTIVNNEAADSYPWLYNSVA